MDLHVFPIPIPPPASWESINFVLADQKGFHVNPSTWIDLNISRIWTTGDKGEGTLNCRCKMNKGVCQDAQYNYNQY